MPDEKQTRNFHEVLRRYGVKNPGEIGLRSPIQLVSVVDDATHIIPPIVTPWFGVAGTEAAGGAGVASGVSLTAGPGGIWVVGGKSNAAFAHEHRFFTQHGNPLAGGAVVNTDLGVRAGDVVSPGTAVLYHGTMLDAAVPAGFLYFDATMGWWDYPPIYLP
ncbi:unnamed protein product, partial [marine sediment metagenome]